MGGALRAVRLRVAYDGTDFCGWQFQPGERTVQRVIEEAVRSMCGDEVRVRGASRTDSGVHALAQVAAFDSARDIDENGWLQGLNKNLPPDVSIKSADFQSPGYDPRYDSLGKRYRYLVLTGVSPDPLLRLRAWYLHPGMFATPRHSGEAAEDWFDFAAMRDAADRMQGTHDFAAFQASGTDRDKTTRTIHAITLRPGHCDDPRLLAIEVDGSAFLKHMVRIVAGTLAEIGRGRMNPSHVDTLLAPPFDRQSAGPTAPAHGLCLVELRLGRSSSS